MDVKLLLIEGRASRKQIKLRLPASVGRAADQWLRIDHRSVSRQHCELFERDGTLFVRDCGSANGTLVDDRPVQEEAIEPGQRLTVGPLVFEVMYERVNGVDNHPLPAADAAATLAVEAAPTVAADEPSEAEAAMVVSDEDSLDFDLAPAEHAELEITPDAPGSLPGDDEPLDFEHDEPVAMAAAAEPTVDEPMFAAEPVGEFESIELAEVPLAEPAGELDFDLQEELQASDLEPPAPAAPAAEEVDLVDSVGELLAPAVDEPSEEEFEPLELLDEAASAGFAVAEGELAPEAPEAADVIDFGFEDAAPAKVAAPESEAPVAFEPAAEMDDDDAQAASADAPLEDLVSDEDRMFSFDASEELDRGDEPRDARDWDEPSAEIFPLADDQPAVPASAVNDFDEAPTPLSDVLDEPLLEVASEPEAASANDALADAGLTVKDSAPTEIGPEAKYISIDDHAPVTDEDDFIFEGIDLEEPSDGPATRADEGVDELAVADISFEDEPATEQPVADELGADWGRTEPWTGDATVASGPVESTGGTVPVDTLDDDLSFESLGADVVQRAEADEPPASAPTPANISEDDALAFLDDDAPAAAPASAEAVDESAPAADEDESFFVDLDPPAATAEEVEVEPGEFEAFDAEPAPLDIPAAAADEAAELDFQDLSFDETSATPAPAEMALPGEELFDPSAGAVADANVIEADAKTQGAARRGWWPFGRSTKPSKPTKPAKPAAKKPPAKAKSPQPAPTAKKSSFWGRGKATANEAKAEVELPVEPSVEAIDDSPAVETGNPFATGHVLEPLELQQPDEAVLEFIADEPVPDGVTELAPSQETVRAADDFVLGSGPDANAKAEEIDFDFDAIDDAPTALASESELALPEPEAELSAVEFDADSAPLEEHFELSESPTRPVASAEVEFAADDDAVEAIDASSGSLPELAAAPGADATDIELDFSDDYSMVGSPDELAVSPPPAEAAEAPAGKSGKKVKKVKATKPPKPAKAPKAPKPAQPKRSWWPFGRKAKPSEAAAGAAAVPSPEADLPQVDPIDQSGFDREVSFEAAEMPDAIEMPAELDAAEPGFELPIEFEEQPDATSAPKAAEAAASDEDEDEDLQEFLRGLR
ncbi:MAG: FHA domain-containing protein [Pirellulales bacterium]|nr:FHA domain-containing protein [Pirellulales bacterium]